MKVDLTQLELGYVLEVLTNYEARPARPWLETAIERLYTAFWEAEAERVVEMRRE